MIKISVISIDLIHSIRIQNHPTRLDFIKTSTQGDASPD